MPTSRKFPVTQRSQAHLVGNATFEDMWRYFELLDEHGKLAIDKNAKVIAVQCRIKKPQRQAVPILLLSSNQNGNTFELVLTARLVIEQ